MSKIAKHLGFFVFVFAAALVMASLEVQIEGSFGWAKNLPTWRIYPTFSLLGMWGTGDKPLTGYHLYLWIFVFILCHTGIIFSKWSWKNEAKALALYILITTLEGILWFVVNPSWGLANFKQGISWYKEMWVLGVPLEYYYRFGAGLTFYILGNLTKKKKTNKLKYM